MDIGSTHAQAKAHPPKEIKVPEHPQKKRIAHGADHKDAEADADAEALRLSAGAESTSCTRAQS